MPMIQQFYEPTDPNEQKLWFIFLSEAQAVQAHANTQGRSTILSAHPSYARYNLVVDPAATEPVAEVTP